ncbi:DUF4179 domain-containing protein [Romboutsia sedimentorum]|uniref:DUF4179 domain-containing protein n=1 Tax=Romboutsia sedimentorum TaxID=1368474 RepID=A0ABT7E626_9FIRM|nr:DUF4179 domain-containing protein [Romboutsia sedimentorum]MDK2562379.1 DUF4179 domain-containing protein [Romboutsia sedimentorum]
MKDIYELLNDVDIDESEFDEIKVNYIEKTKVKRKLKDSIKKDSIKKKNNWKKKAIVAATIGVIATATFGTIFPSYAKNIPIIGDIFRALDNDRTGLYDNYKENANEINVTKESKGISITVNDAVFDGKTINLTYTIESDKDLGDKISFSGRSIVIKGDEYTGSTGSSQVVKIDKNTYVGQYNMTISNFVDKPRDSVHLQLNIKKLILPNKDTKITKEIKGHWKFDITLDAIKGNTQVINQSVQKEGATATIKELNINPMSMSMIYSQKISKDILDKWDSTYLDIKIKDDLGNSYSGQDNGGSGDIYGNMTWSKTLEKPKENATKLIITPIVELSINTKDNSGGVEYDADGKEKPIVSKLSNDGSKKEIVLDDIIVELNK